MLLLHHLLLLLFRRRRCPFLHEDNNNNNIIIIIDDYRRLTSVTGDLRETMYLFQRVSLAVQRYNSMAFKGTFLVPTELD